MFDGFQLQGNRPFAIRSDEEMRSVNGEAADWAFKAQKKLLDQHLAKQGFVTYKTNACIRRNALDVLEYINLQKESHGSRTFTVNYALIPLYIPHDFLSYDLGGRLGTLICSRDVWWDYADEAVAAVSFQNVTEAIERFLLPWFDQTADRSALEAELLRVQKARMQHGGRLSDIQQAWLDALDDPPDADAVIRENIRRFKLPQKLFL